MNSLFTLAIIAMGIVWLDNNAMGRLFPNDFYCAVGAGYTYEVVDVIDDGIRTPQERSANPTVNTLHFGKAGLDVGRLKKRKASEMQARSLTQVRQ